MKKKDQHDHEDIVIETDPTKITESRWDDKHIMTMYPHSKEFKQSLQADGLNLVATMKKIAKGLKRRKNVHCPNCGALQPELIIEFDGKIYAFTCFEVTSKKTKKALRKTDYAKLHEYTKPKKKKSQEHKSQ